MFNDELLEYLVATDQIDELLEIEKNEEENKNTKPKKQVEKKDKK